MTDHREFEKRINKSLKHMEAKISFLHDGVKGLAESFGEFQEDITDYMAYTSEKYAEHESRISKIEKQLGI